MRILWIVSLLLAAGLASAQEITVAAASDLQNALRRITQNYEKQTGEHVRLSFGASGNLVAEIENGAPYDLFFSADIGYAQRLITDGRALPDSLYEYAVGRLVLWVPANSPLDVQKGFTLLTNPRVHKIAIANPKHAPYGRAAEQALKSAAVYERVKDKLVLGENISQTKQFASSGNADVGLVSLSLVVTPPGAGSASGGKYWVVPSTMYSPVKQAAVVIKGTHTSAAAKFLAYIKSDAGRRTLKEYGFEEAQE